MLMRRINLLSAIIGSVLVLMAGCTSSTQEKASTQEQKAYTPHINPAEFTTTIDNEYFPMKPGTTFFYEGNSKRHAISIRLLWPPG
jgi:hypothetical protein